MIYVLQLNDSKRTNRSQSVVGGQGGLNALNCTFVGVRLTSCGVHVLQELNRVQFATQSRWKYIDVGPSECEMEVVGYFFDLTCERCGILSQ